MYYYDLNEFIACQKRRKKLETIQSIIAVSLLLAAFVLGSLN
jgi:hypothetical protein